MKIDTALQPGHVKVRLDGAVETVAVRALKRGDLVVIARGDKVPADCRLVECHNLRLQEADLTGESEPVDKIPDRSGAVGRGACDPCSMAFMGTRVVAGDGVAEVVATGEQTRWAHLAALTQVVQRKPQPNQYADVEQIMLMLLLALIGALLVLGLLHIAQSTTVAAIVIGLSFAS
jgi:Ca2+-transporting ATPase